MLLKVNFLVDLKMEKDMEKVFSAIKKQKMFIQGPGNMEKNVEKVLIYTMQLK
jgi:hypothetical protein